MNKKIVVGVILIILAGIALFSSDILQKEEVIVNTGVVHKIVLESDGFNPSDLTIQVGDTVEFSSVNGKPFWPASNLHPSHRTYSEFDPKQPIEPENLWSFTFDKVGEWKFHGHLAPYWVGIIRVTK